MSSLKIRNCLAVGIGVLGSLHMIGRIFDIKPLIGVGAASAMSPAPKVFSDVDGLETFASEFTMIVTTSSGERRFPITPELYQNLTGPYNRRNVYGAALSYAPRLPENLWQTVFCYGLKPGGPLRTELGLPADTMSVKVEIKTKTRQRSDIWILDPPC